MRKRQMKPGYEPKNLLGEMGQVCEEAGEVLQHLGKILRFGIDNVSPRPEDSALSNRQLFYRELDDLEACIKRIKARHGANPTEALVEPSDAPAPKDVADPYRKLAEEIRNYFELCEEGGIRPWKQASGVVRRIEIRRTHAGISELIDNALTQDSCKCTHTFAHDKGCPFWPNVKD